jgi:hypothetical protein
MTKKQPSTDHRHLAEVAALHILVSMASMLLIFLRASCQSIQVWNVLSRLHLSHFLGCLARDAMHQRSTSRQHSGGFTMRAKVPTFDSACQTTTPWWPTTARCTLPTPVYHVISVVTQWFRHHPNKQCPFVQSSTMILGKRSLLQVPGLLESLGDGYVNLQISRRPNPETLTRFLCWKIVSQIRPGRSPGTAVVAYKFIYLKPPWNGSGTEADPCMPCATQMTRPIPRKGKKSSRARIGIASMALFYTDSS